MARARARRNVEYAFVSLVAATIGCTTPTEPIGSTRRAVTATCGTPACQAVDSVRGRFRVWRPAANDYSGIRKTDDMAPLLAPSAASSFAVGATVAPTFPPPLDSTTKLQFPAAADGVVQIVDAKSLLGVGVHLVGARVVPAEEAYGYVVYRNGAADGSTVIYRPSQAGAEDYIVFEAAPVLPSVSYRVDLSDGVAGLRSVAGAVEFLDASGTPRLHVARPYLQGADGTITVAELTIAGCAFDADPRPPWGRTVVPPGSRSCTIRASWAGQSVTYPALFDPAWTTGGYMMIARKNHSATLLLDGRVLVVGGEDGGGTLAYDTELFDATTETWTQLGSPMTNRERHAASILLDGRVVIFGGATASGSPIAAPEVWSPTYGWTQIAALPVARMDLTATLLSDGRVLFAGGRDSRRPRRDCDLYDPGSGTWSAATALPSSEARANHTADRVSVAGQESVLVAGGDAGSSTTLATSLLFTPGAGGGSWSPTGGLAGARFNHASAVLQDGRVLVAGGEYFPYAGALATTISGTAEIFDPSTQLWQSAGSLSLERTQLAVASVNY